MASRSGQRITDSRKHGLTLGKLIKSGGAGSVFHLAGRKGEVVKLYHDKIDKPLYQRKIEAMLDLAPKLPPTQGVDVIQIAWPLAEAFDERKRFIGFVMPELDVTSSIELEYILQERQAKAHGLPSGLGAKITLAANLCALIDALHQQHHYVVDMKPLNLRFYKDSLYMAMLDCDGFSIQGHGERFPAGQFTIDYLAPEFQASGMIPQGQEEDQDRFALAVIIFQLLNFGLHPFSGRPQSDKVPTDIPGRIRGHFYAYGSKAHSLIEPAPSSGHEQLADDVRRLFDRAFTGDGRNRPGAAEWLACLGRYAMRCSGLLQVCRKNAGHQHFVGKACAACIREKASQRARSLAPRQATARQQARAQIRNVPPPAPTGRFNPPPVPPLAQPRPARMPPPPITRAPPPPAPPFSWRVYWNNRKVAWQAIVTQRWSVGQRLLYAFLVPLLLSGMMWLLRLYLDDYQGSLLERIRGVWAAPHEVMIWSGLLGVFAVPFLFICILLLAVGWLKLMLGRRP